MHHGMPLECLGFKDQPFLLSFPAAALALFGIQAELLSPNPPANGVTALLVAYSFMGMKAQSGQILPSQSMDAHLCGM